MLCTCAGCWANEKRSASPASMHSPSYSCLQGTARAGTTSKKSAVFPLFAVTREDSCVYSREELKEASSRVLPPVPLDAVVKLDPGPAEAVQGAAYREINPARAQPRHQLQVVQPPPSARVRDGNRAPIRQPRHQLLVDAPLQALVVGCVDEELGAVGLQCRNRLCLPM